MKYTFVGLAIATIIIYFYTAPDAVAADKARLVKLNSENEVLESYQPAPKIPEWPAKRSASAISARWGWGYGRATDRFKVYFWWQNAYLWVEVVPEGDAPFFCSGSFAAIQDGTQYDTIKIVTRAGSSQCGDIYTPSIFWVSQRRHQLFGADFSRNFKLVFDGGETIYRIAIGSNGGRSNPPEDYPGYGDDEDGGGGCLINTLNSNKQNN